MIKMYHAQLTDSSKADVNRIRSNVYAMYSIIVLLHDQKQCETCRSYKYAVRSRIMVI